MIRIALTAALAAQLALTLPAQAAGIAFNDGWKEQRFALFSSNDYGFGRNRLSVKSDGTVSMAYARVDPTLWPAKQARWSWAVSEGVPATDLRRKGGDDRNLALYFVFLPETKAQALSGSGIRKLLAEPDARVLVYVWGGNHERRAFLDSPYLGARGKTVVQRGTGTGSFSETVDLAADYGRAFGGAPGALVGLAVSGDSDDTGSRIRAAIFDLSLN